MANQAVIPNEGKGDLLAYQLLPWGTEPNPWMLRLFKNDFVPLETSVLADFEQCDFFGYVPWTLFRGSWSVPALVGNVSVSQWGTSAVLFGGPTTPQTVHGAYYTDDDVGVVRFAFRFDTPFVIATATPLRFFPQFTYGTFIPC